MPKIAPAQPVLKEGTASYPPERLSVIQRNVEHRPPEPAASLAGGTAAIMRGVLTRGTLTTRLLVAGTLLLVGLPLLTILVYVRGYPSTPVPLVVVLVDGLQVLIILNAFVVMGQLVLETGIRVPRPASKRSEIREDDEASALRRRRSGGLRELSLNLAEVIWELERRNRTVPRQAILDYIRDAVTAELEHRRRASALERRLAELEMRLRGGIRADEPETDSP